MIVSRLFSFIFTLNIYLSLSFYSHQADKIANNTAFAPSFKSLETLAQELYAKTGNNQRIRITLSDNVLKLPEGERKIAVAVTEYFQLIDKFEIADSGPGDHLDLEMVQKVAANHELLVTVEDNVVMGGAGSLPAPTATARGGE